MLQDVNFEFDSARLTAGAESVLTDVAAKLRSNENVRVRIEGHTDSVGPADYNKDLSQRRADSVASFLASQGISADRMTTIGYGEEQPVASNDTKAGRARTVVSSLASGSDALLSRPFSAPARSRGAV